MGTTNSLLPDLCVKPSPKEWPPLTTALTGVAGEGQEGGGRQRGKTAAAWEGVTSAPRAQTEWKLATVQTLALLVQFFFTVKPQRTKGPANGEGE